jgi:hypothetical protein
MWKIFHLYEWTGEEMQARARLRRFSTPRSGTSQSFGLRENRDS